MTPTRRLSPGRGLVAGGIAAACVALGLTGWATDRLDAVQTRWEDALQPGIDAGDDPPVVIVGFDRRSIAALGPVWPVDRSVHASLIDAIGRGAPEVIVYDVLFTGDRPGDAALAAALAAHPTVIAEAHTLRRGEGPLVAVDTVRPTDQLADASTAVGHANVTLAPDTGIVRSLPVYVVDERGIPLPSLALAAVALAEDAPTTVIERVDGAQVGDRFVPAVDGEVRINWSDGLGADDVVSAVDVLEGVVDPSRFEGAIVLVGATEPTLGDQHLVPVDRTGSTPGIVVIANTVNTMLTNGYLSAPSGGAEAALIVIAGALVAGAFGRLRLGFASVVLVAVGGAVVVWATWRFHAAGEHWDVVWPVVTSALVAVALWAWRYVVEIRHRRRAWAMFATYVPATVVAELAEPALLKRAADSRRSEVSVLFCDLRGFTPIAGGLDPDDVRRLLDHYYDYAVTIIHAHRGTVMQFVGDEVFAVFGAPVADAGAASAAVACAVELQRRIDELDATLASDGLPAIRFGIGVHRGLVTTAHVGTQDRRQYSAIGDTVNVGSRLCGAAGAAQVVASTVAFDGADPAAAGFVDGAELDLKGVAAPVPIRRWSFQTGGS